MSKYLIIGRGYLGNRLKGYLGEEAEILEGRVERIEDVVRAIEEKNVEVVINCAGKTGKPNVDACEVEGEETFFGNVTLPWIIAEACRRKEKKMVHYGTGCTFEGNKFFTEEDEPNFKGSLYSRTKLIAENMLKTYDNVLQIRLRIPIDDKSIDRNLIDKLLKYVKNGGKILIAENSVTPVPFLMKVTKELIEKNASGIYNVVAKGGITHDFILDTYSELSGDKLNYEKISAEELDKITKARRSNCTLSTEKLEKIGIEVPEVKTYIRELIKSYIANKSRGIE